LRLRAYELPFGSGIQRVRRPQILLVAAARPIELIVELSQKTRYVRREIQLAERVLRRFVGRPGKHSPNGHAPATAQTARRLLAIAAEQTTASTRLVNELRQISPRQSP
jgi:hypothetical protein